MNIAITYLIKDGKVLLLYKESRGYYVAPGGKIEAEETIVTAAKREFLEETGLEVTPILTSVSSITTKDEQHHPKSLYTMFTFLATDYQGELLPATKEGVNGWYDVTEIMSLPMFAGDKILLANLLAKIEADRQEMEYASFCYDINYKKLLSHEILV